MQTAQQMFDRLIYKIKSPWGEPIKELLKRSPKESILNGLDVFGEPLVPFGDDTDPLYETGKMANSTFIEPGPNGSLLQRSAMEYSAQFFFADPPRAFLGMPESFADTLIGYVFED